MDLKQRKDTQQNFGWVNEIMKESYKIILYVLAYDNHRIGSKSNNVNLVYNLIKYYMKHGYVGCTIHVYYRDYSFKWVCPCFDIYVAWLILIMREWLMSHICILRHSRWTCGGVKMYWVVHLQMGKSHCFHKYRYYLQVYHVSNTTYR